MEGFHKRLIIFDGISGSGKTTLKDALNRATNYRDLHIHRFTATDWVNSVLNKRPVNLVELNHYEDQIQEIIPTTLVTVTCDPYIALDRKHKEGDTLIEPEIAIANKLFMVYHNYLTCIKRKIVVCTNTRSVDECIKLILTRLPE